MGNGNNEDTLKRLGVTDVPCNEEEQDMLEMKKYVEGLEKFIRECPTPMSIAIQGDWGTGKTSIINMLQKRLEKEEERKEVIKCIYFNTWQYSQFNMAEDLYISFVNTLVHKCCGGHKEKTKELSQIVGKIGCKFLFNTVKDNTGIDLEEFIKQQEEKMQSIENLKVEFGNMVANEVKGSENGRVVIFIDDLDRLNPEIAVELMEVIKLFMDVEKCIFVLAIDYEVVVNGVRCKYGQNVSEEKCRSFFDKIIQLPFRLPVETYNLEELIRSTVADDIEDEYIEALAYFISSLLGSNPRAYKRLANSFFLIKSINEIDKEKMMDVDSRALNNVLTFATLCIQMCAFQLYQIMLAACEGNHMEELCKVVSERKSTKNGEIVETQSLDDYLKKYKIDLIFSEKEKKDILSGLKLFVEFLNDIARKDNIFTVLNSVLQMTTITSVSTEGKQNQRAEAIKVNKVTINKEETNVTTATDAIYEVYKVLLGEDKELIEEYLEEEKRMLTSDENKKDAFFRNRREFCEIDGKKVYIGLSSSTKDKMKYVSKLCEFMKKKGKMARVVWKYNDEVVFSFDNMI